jgi:subfamily B ATP-binding cassette protein MsbA
LLPLSFLLIAEITRRLKHDARKSQEILGRLTAILEETLSGIRVIKGFTAEKFAADRFRSENAAYRKVLKSMLNKRELASPMSEFLGVGVLTLIFLYGGLLVIQHQSELSASEFITYIILYSQILIPAKNITTAVTNIQKGMVSGERIFSIIDEQKEVEESPKSVTLSALQNKIEIRNLHFSHPGKKVLTNINLDIAKGQTVALVGPSGAGKSTLADLLPRFYDPDQGEILIDGISLKNLSIKSLRSLFGIVSQDNILFHDTIRNNIAFGLTGISDEQVIEAAKTANAWEFIQSTPLGLDTVIGDQGSRLSGGQKQRIAIARAVLRNPPILILDEATSALDSESEKLVREALAVIMKGRTCLVIAHRLSTIKDAHLIVAMQDGQIIETGNHAELSAKNGLYKRLINLQGFGE